VGGGCGWGVWQALGGEGGCGRWLWVGRVASLEEARLAAERLAGEEHHLLSEMSRDHPEIVRDEGRACCVPAAHHLRQQLRVHVQLDLQPPHLLVREAEARLGRLAGRAAGRAAPPSHTRHSGRPRRRR